MATFNHNSTIRQACVLSYDGKELGYTLDGVRIEMTPVIYEQKGEEEGDQTINAYWGGYKVKITAMLLQTYADADVIQAGFNVTGGTVPSTSLKIGQRIDNTTYSKTLIITPKVAPGVKVTVNLAFGVINGSIPLRLRGDVYYPVHFFCWVRSTDQIKFESVAA